MPASLSDPSIVTLFRNAPQSSRQAFLSTISLEFRPSDWNHLHHILHEKSYYFDFIPILPVEITLQILRYLPLKELILLRLVSHNWNSILRSPEVCRSLIHHFFPTISCIGLFTDPVTLFENLSSRRLAFVRRKPSALYRLDTYSPVEHEGLYENAYYVDVDFAHFRMAWVEGEDRNIIVVRDLLSVGESPEVLPKTFMDDRCHISEVALSDTLVAAVSSTMGICQVWDLATRATHSFRMPGAVVAALHADGSIIGILLHRQNLEYQLIVHNAATRKTKCIDIACEDQYNGNQVIVHAASNRVVHVKLWVAGEMDIELTSWSTDSGKSLEKLTQRVGTRGEVRQLQPVGDGRWAIKACLSHNPATMHISHWQLDLAQPKLEITPRTYRVPIERPLLRAGVLGPHEVGYLGTSGDATWAIIYNNLEYEISSPTGLVWEEDALQARTIALLPNDSYAPVSSRPLTPYYLDPHDRFILWGCRGLESLGEQIFLEGRGFEDTTYLVEIYRGIHECGPESTR